jgi:hypothetical protein
MVKGCERNGVVDADAVVHTLGSWSGQLEVVSEAFEVRLFYFLALFAKDFHKWTLFGKISKNGP